MINFYSENNFDLEQQSDVKIWMQKVIENEDCKLGEINVIFCDDAYLHKLNVEFLEHDTLTDIITFDNSLGKQLFSEIYISTERVLENSKEYDVAVRDELHRVLIHGVLHLCGYKDKSEKEQLVMTAKENESLLLRKF